VDLRIVDEAVFGAALLYFTGSKRHNVVLRERAARAGLRLNEYGLFPDDGEEAPPQTRGVPPVAADTEQAIYAALDLPWIPPELREDRGEFEFGDDLPALVELGDIRSELHAHTRASDGRLTIEQLAAAAAARGFHTVAVTDHSQSSIQANGLSPERLRAHVRAVREADARIDGIRILAGTEVDILADGHLDYDDELLAELDIVVASPHTSLRQDPEEATARLVRAVSHPHVHILGHPTGRMLGRREGLHPDMRAVVAAAAEHDTALEINANELRLDLRDVHVQAAVEAGALVSINCDTHRAENLDQFRYGVLTARRGRLTAARCLNTWPRADLLAWLARKSPALAAEA
jgi:DNA polymerase (family 10)